MACILIADDDADTRESLREILEGEGYRVRVAASGDEVLAGVQEADKPAVVLLDESMPQMTGSEVLDWIARHRDLDNVPVVIVSGESRVLKHPRAAATLRKPFGIDELLDVARRYCNPERAPLR